MLRRDLGWLVLRRRLVAFSYRSSLWAWVGPTTPEDIVSTFERFCCCQIAPSVSADLLIGDSDANAKHIHEDIAGYALKRRSTSNGFLSPFPEFLSPGEREHLRLDEEVYNKHIQKFGPNVCLVSDLSQNPAVRENCSAMLTTVAAHSNNSPRPAAFAHPAGVALRPRLACVAAAEQRRLQRQAEDVRRGVSPTFTYEVVGGWEV